MFQKYENMNKTNIVFFDELVGSLLTKICLIPSGFSYPLWDNSRICNFVKLYYNTIKNVKIRKNNRDLLFTSNTLFAWDFRAFGHDLHGN